jgi:hypothetical protein
MQYGTHQASYLMRTRSSYGEGKATGVGRLPLPSAENHHTWNFTSTALTYLQVLFHCQGDGSLLVTTHYTLFWEA